ncbi:MAG TPA: hypothetical protein VK760_02710 [Candidatus Acidoferrales bacterium]|jgi:hypothetical protein|nr:hypothetical protein [Candidatus Acidoferrales bacterium]
MTTSWGFRDTAFVAAAAALGACSNAAPSPSALPSNAEVDSVDRQTSGACAAPPGYAFEGPCAEFLLTQKGGTVTVPADRGYAFSYVLPANAIPKSVMLAYGTATRGQIGVDENQHAFPAYDGFGKAFLYVVGYSAGDRKAFKVDGPSKLIVTASNGFPGTACRVAVLDRNTWRPFPAKPTIQGEVLTVTLRAKATQLSKGKAYLAFACR